MTQIRRTLTLTRDAVRLVALMIVVIAAAQTVMVAAIGRGPIDGFRTLAEEIAHPAVDTAPLGRIPAVDPNALVRRTPLVLPVRPDTSDQLLPAVLGPGTDVSPAQAQLLHEAADRVCEGFTAGVPVVVMEPELMREFAFTGEEAHQFVIAAHAEQCPLA